ncbi:hypothetical protein Z949_1203 [Sulfitobacter guttiformis KCTC 32187]|nr:hypothetical protein Z949_1203 [Sulfitobacter guttiformis KCTC 32187]
MSRIPIPIKDSDGQPLRWQIPTVQVETDRLWRIYISGRTLHNDIGAYFLEVEPHNGMRVVNHGTTLDAKNVPKRQYGDHGVGPSCCYQAETGPHIAVNLVRLNPPVFDASIGFWPATDIVAQFNRDPEIENFEDNKFAVSPFILKENGVYHMWYGRGTGWRMDAEPNPEPTYAIAHATSKNGVDGWVRDEAFAIPPRDAEETGITRTIVQKRTDGGDGWEMWYSYRGMFDLNRPTLRDYKIGYAISSDLVTWDRRDDAHEFINPPVAGDWDSDMQCYCFVVPHEDREIMIYCGNGYGFSGIGYAERVVKDTTLHS